MGLFVTRIIFNNGLPNFSEVKQKFKKQTGLELQLIANLSLYPISNDPEFILHQLMKDFESYTHIPSPKTFSEELINK